MHQYGSMSVFSEEKINIEEKKLSLILSNKIILLCLKNEILLGSRGDWLKNVFKSEMS